VDPTNVVEPAAAEGFAEHVWRALERRVGDRFDPAKLELVRLGYWYGIYTERQCNAERQVQHEKSRTPAP
jgi:hypothetical protein